MMMIWSMSGVPRIIQTNVRDRYRIGAEEFMLPKAITSPSGKAPTSVTRKSLSV